MGSWDCYCFICGGPFGGSKISEKPRSATFLRQKAKEMERQRLGKEGADGEDQDAKDDEDDRDDDDRCEEDYSYDRDVVSTEDVEWTTTLHVLGFNPDSEEETKSFVSGPGTYHDYGGVDVEMGDDPNAEDVDLGWATCYQNQDNNCDAIYPFHWCCYELLAKCIAGSFDDDDLDKDLLYSIMQDLSVDYSCAFSKIDYGDASRMQDQFWSVVPGYEFLVSHPRNVPAANDVVLSKFASDAFKQRSSCNDLGRRVRNDPFLRTPYDIICRICGFISDDDLINLRRASWPIHALLQNNDQFWRHRLRTSFFPWFFELRELLDQDQTLLETNNPQRIFQWAERSTRPEKWLTGDLMGVVNRRRIWSACEQLGDLYRLKEEEENDPSISDEERLIRTRSKCDFSVIVSSPEPAELNSACRVYWLKSWSEVRSQTKTLESFWDSRGSLVGISLTPDGQERRLLGLAGSDDDGILKESIKLGAEEWIKGLVLHLPVPTYLDDNDDQLRTSPKGLTIILDSGRTSGMGNISGCQMQRLLSANPDWCITGIHGTTGFVMDNLQLTMLGVVQAQHPDVGDYSVLPHHVPTQLPHRLGQVLWDDDYSKILGHSIQEHQTLQLMEAVRSHESNGFLRHDLMSHGALIWAKDVGEHRALRRLTGCIVSSEKEAKQCLSAVIAEYEPTTDLARRVVGVEKTGAGPDVKPTGLFESFDIDGPGGEVVTELEVPRETFKVYTMALKIHTNRGRTCYWGETDVEWWEKITAPAGETLVGLVVKFGGLDRRRDDVDKTLGHNVMSVVGGLSMPLEAKRDGEAKASADVRETVESK